MDTVVLALRVLLSLAVVLGLLWLLQRRFSRGAKKPGRHAAVEIIARQRLTAKATLVVAESGGKRLLLGVTEHSVQVLMSDAIEEVQASVTLPELVEGSSRHLHSVPLDELRERTGDEPRGRAALRQREVLREPAELGQLRPRRHRRSTEVQHPLQGSILSPTTWKQTAEALRQRR